VPHTVRYVAFSREICWMEIRRHCWTSVAETWALLGTLFSLEIRGPWVTIG